MTHARRLIWVMGVLGVLGCGEEAPKDPPKPKDHTVYQTLFIEASCLEDHVKERFTASYKGYLILTHNITKNTYSAFGSVDSVDLLNKILEGQADDQYNPPWSVNFFTYKPFSQDVVDVFSQDVMTLKGYGPGTDDHIKPTCKIKVIERRDGSLQLKENKERLDRFQKENKPTKQRGK